MSSPPAYGRSVLACLVLASALSGTEFQVGPGESVVPNQLLVRYKAGTALNAVTATLVLNSQVQAISNLSDVYLVQLPPGTPPSFSTQLSRQSTVEYVEHNHIRHTSLAVPNDPNYAASQYALQKIQALRAWQLLPSAYLTAATAGTARLKIAILDSGADCTHPDFINSGGISPDAALGGQILFSASQALVATTHSPANCSWQDDNGHGTHVSGIVGAATNNGAGVASLGYPVELIEYKVLDASGTGSDADIASAIRTAANAGASVISMSLGAVGYSQTLQDAVNYAWQRNCVIVAAAGNDGTNELVLPAGANHALGVAATDQNDNRASFSNFGSIVSIAAPGVGILSTFPTYHVTLNDPPENAPQNYATLSGTSMATPHVAALAGLIDMATPGLSAMAALQRIERSGDFVPQSTAPNGGWDQNFGYGRINAFNAVSGALRTASVGGIVGQVVDHTGLPVSSATVAIPGQSPIVTDNIPTGLFRLSNLNAGSTYTITVSATGFSPVNVKAAVAPGADTIVTIVLGAVTGEFHGIVSDGGVPLAGVVVQALSAGLIQATSITDSTGAYSLLVLPGTFDLRASAVAGVTTTVTSQSVASNASTLVNISMARMGSISGTVIDAAGNLVSGAQIIVAATAFSIGATTSNGSYSTIPVPAGAYSVTLTASGFPSVTATAVAVTNDHVTNVNFTGVTVATNPTGLSAVVDGTTYTAPQAFLWAAGSNHTVTVNSPQNGTAGTRYAWSNWSDGLAISHNITVPSAPATYTANFTTQYLLTLAAAPSGGGTVSANPSSTDGYYASGTLVQITATANSGYQFSNFSGDLSGAANPQSVAMTAPRSVTVNFTALTAITVTTSPPGLGISVDGTSYTAPQNFNWLPGSNHTLAVNSPQNGTAGTRYAWSNWSDAGAISHNVTAPGTASTYTANFSAQYLLTVTASPVAGGALAASPSSTDGYYASGTLVQITATANSGYQFSNFSGDLSGAVNPQSVAMTAPRSVTVNFTALAAITVTTSPPGLGISVDGTSYTAPQNFNWLPGSNHTLAVNSPQNATAGTRYAWSNWSDAGAISHNVTAPGTASTYTANFSAQYLLTVTASPVAGGALAASPSSTDGYYASGTLVQITATANSGYQFSNFSGDLSGAANPQSVAMTAPRSVTVNFTALTAITVTTSPPGLGISVDGTSYTAPQNFNWLPGSNHTLAVNSPQNATAGTRYAWSNWSDAGAISHIITAPGTASTYTANFSAQYLLTVTASPAAGGALAANPPSTDGYYPSGTSVQITATANSGYQFSNFLGDLSGAANPQSVAMTAPRSVTASFAVASTLAIDRAKLSFGVANGVATSPQTIQITTQAGVGWTASSNQPNISISPPSGVGSGTLQITAGAGSSGVVTVTVPGAAGSPQQIQVSVSSVTPGVPFGSFDTPADNTTGIAGAIAVTGWALDNVEVSEVDIWREPVGNEPAQSNGLVLIGNAVFVAGSRPDVEATYPGAPLNYRAGWGYMLLTNFLPNSGGSPGPGNGTYKLHAIATNKTGQTLDLGTRTITVDNAHASKPFGTIDTPAQGGSVSGNAFVNFGWALTQNPKAISTDGSTITVILDGVPVGHPTYNQFRSDIANLFPGLANSNGAVGFFYIDTTKLANGVHTISWNVFDNAGHGDGIGSRYFTVANTGAVNMPVTGEPIEPSQIAAGGTDVYTVSIEELDRVELPLGAAKGYLLVNGERRPLPVGSTLKGGRFYWQAGPGFLGEYDLLFEQAGATLLRVRVKIQPKTYAPRESR